MEDNSDGQLPSAQYALVGYIPDALGDFLNDLREELIPSCRLLSHITLLPPRLLSSHPDRLEQEVAERVRGIAPFEVQLGAVEIFPGTDVVYLSIVGGRETVEALHDELHQSVLRGTECFPFHPHVTLAQEIPPNQVYSTYLHAQRRWWEWNQNRHFQVETLTFVRNVDPNTWVTVAEFNLREPRPLSVASVSR